MWSENKKKEKISSVKNNCFEVKFQTLCKHSHSWDPLLQKHYSLVFLAPEQIKYCRLINALPRGILA